MTSSPAFEPAGRAGRRSILALFLAIATAGLLAASEPAKANGPEVSIQDDRMFQQNPAAAAQRARSLGAHRVRMTVFWRSVLPGFEGRNKPAGFRGWVHTEPQYNWGFVDNAVQEIRAAGMRVHLTITTPGPIWASANPNRNNGAWRPSTLEFSRFALAAVERYKGQVDLWSIGNEPNHPHFLQPQSMRSGGRMMNYAPHHYRDMVRRAYPRMRRADPSARYLIGETMPSGHTRVGRERPIRPLRFWREFGCRDTRMRPMRRHFCRGFRSAQADGIAHHPHLMRRSPTSRMRHRDDASLNETRQFLRTIDQLQSRRAIRKRGRGRFSVWYTEFGYQTNPPDRRAGVSWGRQSVWLQEFQFRVWRHSRVRGWTQYIMVDPPPRSSVHQWDSGFWDHTGRAKNSLRTWHVPFVVSKNRVRRGERVRFWGQAKRPEFGRRTVVLEYRNRGSSNWRRLRSVSTDVRGYFAHTRRAYGNRQYRFREGDLVSAARTVRAG